MELDLIMTPLCTSFWRKGNNRKEELVNRNWFHGNHPIKKNTSTLLNSNCSICYHINHRNHSHCFWNIDQCIKTQIDLLRHFWTLISVTISQALGPLEADKNDWLQISSVLKWILSTMNIVHVLIKVCSFWTLSSLCNVLFTLFSNFGLCGLFTLFTKNLTKHHQISLNIITHLQTSSNIFRHLQTSSNTIK